MLRRRYPWGLLQVMLTKRTMQYMPIAHIANLAKKLNKQRQSVESAESDLQRAVANYLSQCEGSARAIAGKMGVSVQYVCDIRYGRRKISAAVLAKLEMAQ